ncbi:MATE family efflux transporter [Ramlibacter tataouinensis]|uniref:MATE family efflux transporter n=1 Tax=Ramlibacter tataouinensis TaxID=94132 RepID=UPI0022F3AA75|nr:MATE family efflux transporter [Ramlibacter tataouinensis]WBY01389.1 MATE family efflux transporter [Ramlibacter tataouinensis]
MSSTAAALPAAALWTRFGAFLAPLVLTNVLQALSGTLNNIYLGRMLGTDALAAAVAFFPLLMFLIALVIGLGTGSSILAGQAWGARKPEVVQRVAGTTLAGAGALGLLVMGIGLLAIEPVLRGLRTPPEVLPQAVAYARVLLLALPALFLSLLSAALLRGVGDSITPLRMLVITTAASMLLTPALIRGWLGLPQLGVASAAWAVLAGNVASLGWLAWHLSRRHHVLAWPGVSRHLGFDAALLGQVVRLGLPTALFFITGSLADIALLSLVNAHGLHATAAWGAVNQVMAYVQFPAISISIAASVFAAQAIGGGRQAQLPQVTRIGLGMNLALTGGLALLVALLARRAAGLFVDDPAVVDLATQALRIAVAGSVLFGMASVLSGVMRAAGTLRVPTLISLGCLALLMFPLGWTFGRTFGLPWIWLAYPATYGVGLLLQAAYFFGAWTRRPVRALV